MTVPGGDADIELVTVRDVELVKVGDWPAVTGPVSITPEKLASMVEASNAGIFEHAPTKIGHFDPRFARLDGSPALGWLENVRVKGTSLFADISRVPKKIAPLLASAYRKRSIEWEENVTGSDGKKYPAVLKALSLLGANEPAVTGLADVVDIFAAALGADPADIRDRQVAFLGQGSDEIAKCLSRLSELIQAPDEKSGNDVSDTDLGGKVADLSEARVRELLDLSADADIEAELAKLKGAKASDDTGTGGDDDKSDETKPDDTKTDVTKTDTGNTGGAGDGEPADAGDGTELVTVSKAVITELQSQAALGVKAYQELNESKVDAELKAAAKAGKIAPSEVSVIREQLLNPQIAEGARKMLSARPAILPTTAIGDSATDTSAADDAAFTAFASGIFGDELATIGKAGA